MHSLRCQAPFPVRFVAVSLMTQVTGRDTLNARMEARESGPASYVGNLLERGMPRPVVLKYLNVVKEIFYMISHENQMYSCVAFLRGCSAPLAGQH